MQSLYAFFVMLWGLFCIIMLNDASAYNLKCKDWLAGQYVGLTDPTSTGNSLDTSRDEVGDKGQCRDYFPTWGEREKFERTNVDPFLTQYRVTRQYCWARFFLDGSNNCGGPSVSRWCMFIPCGFTWDPPAYTCWGDTTQVLVTAADIANECKTVTLISGFNQAVICRFPMGSDYKHGGKNNTLRSKVCAYYKPWFLSGIVGRGDYKRNLIGCVDEPFKSGPGPYNIVMPSGTTPYVDTSMTVEKLIAIGSRFDQPIVKLLSMEADIITGDSVQKELFLRYRFDGDNSAYTSEVPYFNAPKCGRFMADSTEYCAYVSSDSPNEVCACEQNKCDQQIFLGCVPRPTPAQSGLAIVGEYYISKNSTGELYPAISVMLANLDVDKQPVILDKNNSKTYLDSSTGNRYKIDEFGNKTTVLAEQPLHFSKRGGLPHIGNPVVIKEFFADAYADGANIQFSMRRDTKTLYGIELAAIIPEIDSAGNVQTMKVKTVQQQQQEDGCWAFTREERSDVPTFIVAAGSANRNRDGCCPASITDKTQCIIPPYRSLCDGSPHTYPPYKDKGKLAPARDIAAERAVCPGIYQGPNNPSKPDKICVINQSSWADAMPKPFCIEMPINCSKVSVPSAASGYTIWDKELKPGEVQRGVCDIAYGVEPRYEVIVTLNNISNAPDPGKAKAAQDYFKRQLSMIQNAAKQENRNVQLSELPDPAKSYVTVQMVPQMPQRTCTANVFSAISNPCVFANRCVSITKPSPIRGNMTLPDSSQLYKTTAYNELSSLKSGEVKDLSDVHTVEGRCEAPAYHKVDDDKLPNMQCLTSYRVDNRTGDITLKRQIWQESPMDPNTLNKGGSNPCVPEENVKYTP